jgi:hypothetical protein
MNLLFSPHIPFVFLFFLFVCALAFAYRAKKG